MALKDAPDAVLVSEYQLSPCEVFRVEVCPVGGRDVVRLSRLKMTPDGIKRGGSFEFGAHRLAGVSKLIADLESYFNKS